MITTAPGATRARTATTRDWVALTVLTLAVTLIAVDGTVLALAAPALTEALAPTATQLLWIGDVYSFAVAGLLVTMGNVADRFGRKRQLMIGSVAFAAASALAAFAPTAEMLILARALLGVAAASLMPSTLSIIRNIFEVPAQRTRAVAVWSAGALGGAAVAPLVGGYLLENFWWGAVFLINVPVVLVLVGVGIFVIPESRNPHPGPFDVLSAVLSMSTIIPLVYAVKHLAGHGFDWTVLPAAAVGLVSGFVFVRRQRSLTFPLIDVALFRDRAFLGAVLAALVSTFALSGLLFFFSQYLQLVRGYGPFAAGLRELPLTIASIGVILLVGIALARLGRGRAIAAGLLLAALGMGGLAIAEGASTYLWIGVALVAIGLGLGLSSTLTTDAVVGAAPRDRAGSAAAIAETAYELGVALGIALLGSLLTILYRAALTLPAGLPGGQRDAITESLAQAVTVSGQQGALLAEAQHAFTAAMQVTSGTAAILLAIGALLAWRVIPSAATVERQEH
ncbi:MFS transporter [Clavibacter zhangzhiyongii]|uniref:MFS transporter n=1 Tax=Clavibacter zhangzhiyongii TaxID=2768071 RepID=UPI0039E1215E